MMDKLKNILSISNKIMGYVKILPIRFMVFVIILSWVLGPEFFPFSRFPMYDSFAKKPFVIMITDENDKPLAFYRDFNVIASGVKKSYNKKLRAKKFELKEKYPQKFAKLRQLEIPLEHKEKIAKQVINEIRARSKNPPDKYPVIKLYEIQIFLANNGIQEKKVFINSG